MTDSNDQQPKKKKKGDILLTLVLISRLIGRRYNYE